MIQNSEDMIKDYIECLQDESGIKFIEKYLYTFDATKGKKDAVSLISKTKSIS